MTGEGKGETEKRSIERPETTKKGFRKNLTKVNNMQYWYINAHGLKKRGVEEMYSVRQPKSLVYL